MPKAQRIRNLPHLSSVKRKQSEDAAPATSLDLLPNVAEPETAHSVQLTKKEKVMERRQSFLRKLGSAHPSFSKSHERRTKRKAKEQLAGQSFLDLSSALPLLEKEDSVNINNTDPPIKDSEIGVSSKKTHRKQGVIGEGKPHPLSKNQRKRALELERLRHPLILQNPEFSANPFQTIRIHAQNTLLKNTHP